MFDSMPIIRQSGQGRMSTLDAPAVLVASRVALERLPSSSRVDAPCPPVDRSVDNTSVHWTAATATPPGSPGVPGRRRWIAAGLAPMAEGSAPARPPGRNGRPARGHKQGEVRVSESHHDYFVKNKLMLVAEEWVIFNLHVTGRASPTSSERPSITPTRGPRWISSPPGHRGQSGGPPGGGPAPLGDASGVLGGLHQGG
jgi:hypothetical protein